MAHATATPMRYLHEEMWLLLLTACTALFDDGVVRAAPAVPLGALVIVEGRLEVDLDDTAHIAFPDESSVPLEASAQHRDGYRAHVGRRVRVQGQLAPSGFEPVQIEVLPPQRDEVRAVRLAEAPWGERVSSAFDVPLGVYASSYITVVRRDGALWVMRWGDMDVETVPLDPEIRQVIDVVPGDVDGDGHLELVVVGRDARDAARNDVVGRPGDGRLDRVFDGMGRVSDARTAAALRRTLAPGWLSL